MPHGKRAVLFALVLATGLGICAWACAHGKEDWLVPESAKKVKNPVAASPASIAVGKALYTDNCASCHGEQGKGDGPDAMMYSPMPADLSDAHMMSEMTDGEIFYKITEGRKPMPSFKKKLADEQRWQLVNFLRTLASMPAEKPAAKKSAPAKH